MALGSFLLASAAALLAVAILIKNDDFSPKDFTLPPPPKFVGPLAVKPVKDGEKLFEGKLSGPESVIVEEGTIYTCTADARCVKLVNGKEAKVVRLTKHTDCDGRPQSIHHCGRPLGIRRWNAKKFVVADAMLGIYSVDFDSGESERLMCAQSTVVDGKRVLFADDLDFIDADTIVFSDASTRWDITRFHMAILEHASDARLLQLKISTGEVTTLLEGLNFANGVQIHPDKKSVLVAESGSARIQRYYFAGPKRGRSEMFADNLPGYPDNVRLSASGKSFFVALFSARGRNSLSFADRFAQRPLARKLIGEIASWLPQPLFERGWTLALPSEYGLVVELDLEGNTIDSYHDTSGTLIKDISQVTDDGGKYLYLASFSNSYIGRILKH